jgi:hypothetical protein
MEGKMPHRSRLHLMRLILIALMLGASLSLIEIPIAYGKPNAIFTVTNLNNSGPGSLRLALNQANASDGPDLIDIQVNGTIKLDWDLPQIAGADEDLVINGPSNGVTINGNGHQVFYVNHRGLTLSNVKITNAYFVGDFGGSAIYNDHGKLNVINNTFIANNSTAVYTNFGTVTIANSTFDGNIGGQGAALFNDSGTIHIANSIFRNNNTGSSGNPSVPLGGGAIYHLGGTLNVYNTTLYGNSAQAGGAMLLKGGTVNLANTTFISNTAAASAGGTGGAMYIVDGTINLTNNTITNNNAGTGGGIYVNFGTTSFTNTIIANNSIINCAGTIVDGGGNLTFPATEVSCPGSFSVGDPKFDVAGLRNNGGAVPTLGLQLTSAASDIGVDSACTAPFSTPSFGAGSIDARGATRPIGAHCDSGAFEARFYIFPLIFR